MITGGDGDRHFFTSGGEEDRNMVTSRWWRHKNGGEDDSKWWLVVMELVSWCFEPSQPQRITSGLGGNGDRKIVTNGGEEGRKMISAEWWKHENCYCYWWRRPEVVVGLLQQLFVGHAKEPATVTTENPEHCCKSCHSNTEVRSHSRFGWATQATRWNAYWLLNPDSCVQLHEWGSLPVPSGTNTLLPSTASSAVLHPVSSSYPQCRPRKKTNKNKQKKNLWSQGIFQCYTQTVEQSAN